MFVKSRFSQSSSFFFPSAPPSFAVKAAVFCPTFFSNPSRVYCEYPWIPNASERKYDAMVVPDDESSSSFNRAPPRSRAARHVLSVESVFLQFGDIYPSKGRPEKSRETRRAVWRLSIATRAVKETSDGARSSPNCPRAVGRGTWRLRRYLSRVRERLFAFFLTIFDAFCKILIDRF